MIHVVTIRTHFPARTLSCEVCRTDDPLEAAAELVEAVLEHLDSPIPMTIESTRAGRRQSLVEVGGHLTLARHTKGGCSAMPDELGPCVIDTSTIEFGDLNWQIADPDVVARRNAASCAKRLSEIDGLTAIDDGFWPDDDMTSDLLRFEDDGGPACAA